MKLTSSCLNCGKSRTYNPSQYKGKYCSNKCQQEYRYKTVTVPQIESGKGSRGIRRYIAELNGESCSECGLEATWNNKPLKLHLDHIDGNRLNNTIENLRLVCPNCHSQTDTYGGRNNKKGVNKQAPKVSDTKLKTVLKSKDTIHEALLEVGLAITGPNYKRCYKLLDETNPRVSPRSDKPLKG